MILLHEHQKIISFKCNTVVILFILIKSFTIVVLYISFILQINKRVFSHFQSDFLKRVTINPKSAQKVIIFMSRPAQLSQFYGVDVSDYNINHLRNKALIEKDHKIVNIDNAHIYAYAYQQGFEVPSQSRIAKTVNKNKDGAQITVHRLDRVFRNYTYNPYQAVFRKPKKQVAKVSKAKKTQALKKEVFQVFSPEQIAIKCARQAYARQILQKSNKSEKAEVARVPSEQELKRKQHQKQRRLQRKLILKAYKYELFRIFGQIIYSRGWKIGRQQLKENLQLPPESFTIQTMTTILKKREMKAVLDRQLFMLRKKQYQKEKRERQKLAEYLRRFERRTFVPHSQIKYSHKEQDLYDIKRAHTIKSKQCKIEGESVKRLRRRKMRKQKVWYRQKDHPNNKQIKKQIDESTIEYQQIEQDQNESNEQTGQLEQIQNAGNSPQAIEE